MRFTQRRSEPLAGQGQLVRVVGLAIILACLAIPLTEYWGQRGVQSSTLSGQQLRIKLQTTSVECPRGPQVGEGQEQQAQELASLKERLKELEKAKAAAEERAKSGEQQAQELAGLRAQITQLEAAKAAAEQRAKAAAQQQPSSAASSAHEEACSHRPFVNESKLVFDNPGYGWQCKLLRDACLDQGRVLVHSGIKTPEHPTFQGEVFKLDVPPPPIVLAGHAEPSGQAHYMPVSKFEIDIRAPSTLDPPDVRTPRNFNNCTVPLVFAPHYLTIWSDFILWKLGTLGKMSREGVYSRDWVQFVVDSNGLDLPPFYATLLRPHAEHTPLSLAAISSRELAAQGRSRCYSQMMLCNLKFWGQPKLTAREVMEWYKKQYPKKFELPAGDRVFRVSLLLREGKFRQLLNQKEILEQCKRWQLPPGSNFTSVECSTIHDYSPENFPNVMAQVERTNALVGIHGSGMGYGYFLPKGSALVEIICQNFCGQWADMYYKNQMEGDSYQESGYFRLAADKDHCRPGPWEREQKGSAVAWPRDQDIQVEFSVLGQALSKIALGRVWGTDFDAERNLRMNKTQPCPQ